MKQRSLALLHEDYDPNAPTRLCVAVSDLHLTDGSVGTQSLPPVVWERFFDNIRGLCQREKVRDFTLVLDGDVIDLIRSSRWAEANVYPWQREHSEFAEIVLNITEDIIHLHKPFFKLLQKLPGQLKATGVEKAGVIVLLGNHDKEIMAVPKALAYFYEFGLGVAPGDLPANYRRWIGEMYFNDPGFFSDPETVPYLPFYYGDRGFRFFTTHGQWRDADNSHAIVPAGGKPGWSAHDGWQPEVWQKIGFKPFIDPCFGDTVAAGVLSTFIYQAKHKLRQAGYREPRLHRILDELDLYRPTYLAVTRILQETERLKTLRAVDISIAKVLEDCLFDCVMRWLHWDFTFSSSPMRRKLGLYMVKHWLKWMKILNQGFEISAIAGMMRVMAGITRWNHYLRSSEPLPSLLAMPTFQPEYRHYGFRIHGEGHTHIPLQEEVKLEDKANYTYVNFGTWRDRIVQKKPAGYRRRSVMRAFYIFDRAPVDGGERTLTYFVRDALVWGDQLDQIERIDMAEITEPQELL